MLLVLFSNKVFIIQLIAQQKMHIKHILQNTLNAKIVLQVHL